MPLEHLPTTLLFCPANKRFQGRAGLNGLNLYRLGDYNDSHFFKDFGY
ncbi:hypothetical protein [Peribacillus muralis]